MLVRLLLAAAAAAAAAAAEVESDKAPLVCDGDRRTVPWRHVNDDYCDCDDGRDEPATAACTHVLPASAQFACRSPAALGAMVLATHVDDTVCDCCDGSDERPGRCSDTCSVALNATRQAVEERRQSAHAGLAARDAAVRAMATILTHWRARAAGEAAAAGALHSVLARVSSRLDVESAMERSEQLARGRGLLTDRRVRWDGSLSAGSTGASIDDDSSSSASGTGPTQSGSNNIVGLLAPHRGAAGVGGCADTHWRRLAARRWAPAGIADTASAEVTPAANIIMGQRGETDTWLLHDSLFDSSSAHRSLVGSSNDGSSDSSSDSARLQAVWQSVASHMVAGSTVPLRASDVAVGRAAREGALACLVLGVTASGVPQSLGGLLVARAGSDAEDVTLASEAGGSRGSPSKSSKRGAAPTPPSVPKSVSSRSRSGASPANDAVHAPPVALGQRGVGEMPSVQDRRREGILGAILNGRGDGQIDWALAGTRIVQCTIGVAVIPVRVLWEVLTAIGQLVVLPLPSSLVSDPVRTLAGPSIAGHVQRLVSQGDRWVGRPVRLAWRVSGAAWLASTSWGVSDTLFSLIVPPVDERYHRPEAIALTAAAVWLKGRIQDHERAAARALALALAAGGSGDNNNNNTEDVLSSPPSGSGPSSIFSSLLGSMASLGDWMVPERLRSAAPAALVADEAWLPAPLRAMVRNMSLDDTDVDGVQAADRRAIRRAIVAAVLGERVLDAATILGGQRHTADGCLLAIEESAAAAGVDWDGSVAQHRAPHDWWTALHRSRCNREDAAATNTATTSSSSGSAWTGPSHSWALCPDSWELRQAERGVTEVCSPGSHRVGAPVRWEWSNRSLRLVLDGGDPCGPRRQPRRATIDFVCGPEPVALLTVTEPETCVYAAIARSWMACTTANTTALDQEAERLRQAAIQQ